MKAVRATNSTLPAMNHSGSDGPVFSETGVIGDQDGNRQHAAQRALAARHTPHQPRGGIPHRKHIYEQKQARVGKVIRSQPLRIIAQRFQQREGARIHQPDCLLKRLRGEQLQLRQYAPCHEQRKPQRCNQIDDQRRASTKTRRGQQPAVQHSADRRRNQHVGIAQPIGSGDHLQPAQHDHRHQRNGDPALLDLIPRIVTKSIDHLPAYRFLSRTASRLAASRIRDGRGLR